MYCDNVATVSDKARKSSQVNSILCRHTYLYGMGQQTFWDRARESIL